MENHKINEYKTFVLHQNKRSCNGCTKCCDGLLIGNVNGHEMRPGVPCFYLKGQKCSIYETRPEYPCRNFECLWLSTPDLVPEEFWPGQTNIILYDRFSPEGNPYLAIHGKVSVEVLDWAVQLIQFNKRDSIMYEMGGYIKFLSASPKFIEEMTRSR